ncbi:hypothetical protein PV726_31975 [Streptomyces europaeiscabiei]|uniref:hypothetical protein n=1 Tax=Streptomyces europaeiscabiei TaxID=146819 RepID=UPI0029B3E7C6|nr:hypothetical protein [Streptomyces europaeiscabiei]MDX3694874.1 hypothetical protein [Streptomyces europaeiscabiei]
MAATGHQSMRGALRREIASTIGLLTDEHDFTAMRRYSSFTFDNHTTYLQEVENLLRTLTAQGKHTTVALFDPEDYAEFCADSGLEPDTPSSRARFTAELAATGPSVPYAGQPMAELIPALIDEATRKATWEFASTLLARIGTCSGCGEDIGRAAFARASNLLVRILDRAHPGNQHLICSVTGAAPEPLLYNLHAKTDPDRAAHLDEAEALAFTTVLAVGLATHSPGGIVMRTTKADTAVRIYGWRLCCEGLEPLTAAEVFDDYCTDTVSGDLIAPESDVDYCTPPDLGDDLDNQGAHTH